MYKQERIMQWQPFNDGCGIVGWGWDCDVCEHSHNWVTPEIDHYHCKECGAEHYSNFAE